MGMHQDSDEADLKAPVLGISLGDTAVFRLGGLARKDPSLTFRLKSGDINVLAGASRRAYHGVDRILAGSSQLIPAAGGSSDAAAGADRGIADYWPPWPCDPKLMVLEADLGASPNA